MDNPPRAIATYTPNRFIAAGMLVVWLGFVALWLTSGADRPGKLLYGLASVALAALCATDLLWTPRLTVRVDGLAVRSPLVTGSWRWAQIESVRLDQRHRLGLRLAMVEIDAGDHLVLLSRRSLNADPHDVVEVIQAVRAGDSGGVGNPGG